MALQTLDPALRKLLDNLPVGDPDKAEEPKKHVSISCPWTQGEHIIPMGEASEINLGMWYGPPMHSDEIPIRAHIVETGEPVSVAWTNRFYANEMCSLTATITFN